MTPPRFSFLRQTFCHRGRLLVYAALPCLAVDGPGETTWARGVNWTVRPNIAAVPSAVHVDRIYSEDIRQGFLRLGLVRRLVCDGVHLELQRSSDAASGLKRLTEHFDGHDLRRHLVLRHLSLQATGSGQPTLGCLEARPRNDGAWSLSVVDLVKTDGTSLHLDRALLEAGAAGLRVRYGTESWPVEFPLNNDAQP